MFELSNVENNVQIECKITGYQFPANTKDDWCLLKVAVRQDTEYFELIDPAIESSELKNLHTWFTCLAERRLPRFASLNFTEPCISFDFLAYSNDIVRISINLSHELKPEFKLKQFGLTDNNWNIVFDLDVYEISKILNGIRQTLDLFPERSEN